MSNISYVSAKDILKDPFSGFKALTSSRKICLPPRYLGNLSQGIRDQMDSEINLYCTDLQSVVIGYDNIKLLSSVGNIMADSPFLHLRVQADYILFKPTLGCLLKGTVNKISKDHVGCLVHDRFNASIHRPRTHLNGWRGSALRPGQQFPFQVEDIYSNNSVISLRGKLVDQSIIEKYLKSLENDGSLPCAESKTDSSPRKDDSRGNSEGEITPNKEHLFSQKRARTSSGSGDSDEVDGNVSHPVDLRSEKDLCLPRSKKMKTRDVHEEYSHDARKDLPVKRRELEPLTSISVKKRKINLSDTVNESVPVKKVQFDPVVVASVEKSRKKMNQKDFLDISEISGEDTSHLVDSSCENNSGFDNVSGQSKTEKKKKKKKKKESVHEISAISGDCMSDFGDSSILDNSVLNTEESEQSRKEKKKKKKNKKKESVHEISGDCTSDFGDRSILDNSALNYEESEQSCTERKKKKKKKKKAKDVSADGELFATKIKPKPDLLSKESQGESSGEEKAITDLASGLGQILSQVQSKTKKKKNSQKDLLEVMMALQNEVTKVAGRLATPSPAGRKKKKQKKKRKSENSSSSSEQELDVSRNQASSRHKSKSDDSFVVESEPSTSRLSVKKIDASSSDTSVLESVSKKRKRDTTVEMAHHDDELLIRKKKKKLKKQQMSF